MRHRVPSAEVPTRTEPEPPPELLLAGLPNHALARVLARAPKPTTRTKVNEIKDLHATIGAAEWERRVNDKDESVIPLYADLATQIGTAGLRDVSASSINKALNVESVKPG
jgi:hypothetical protein